MSDGNGKDNKPLIIDLKTLTPDKMRINIARGVVDQMRPCRGCKVLTNRTTNFRLSSETAWRPEWECDDCNLACGKLACYQNGLITKEQMG